ncbi:thioredoxin domain-containing protein [Herbiconiux sp. UC225_62]|uniref:thioredoxin domain-containing protein n=1 Tax=Herbiconiux sp. UC225_62 TaxID=3350168 RepID=UPI0036D225A9
MTNRLAHAISPYLRSHAENPVDWFPWGDEAFAAARARRVPVLVSIGYSTCHWCHVMARESFSDPVLAAYLNEHFVAIKVDREEHPEVDTVYLAAAGAFTQDLGWPLNVFVTPEGKAFYGGTYSPPTPVQGHPSFRQVLEAVTDAWTTRNADVLLSAEQVASALAAGQEALAGGPDAAGFDPASVPFDAIVAELGQYEDRQFGGFGGAPKFPVAPVLRFLLEAGTPESTGLATRMLAVMAGSELRDAVEGGFFRYATRRDWTEPHYERMLYDNALLLDAYTAQWARDPALPWAREAAEGIARFLLDVMQLPSGGFASAQDSESTVDGSRVEGGYYKLGAEARSRQVPPALDEKVLSGWNGLAIGALARASLVFGRDDWAMAAEHAADYLIEAHMADGGGGAVGTRLVRASIDGRVSTAAATLEDYGMLADGLLRLAVVTGSVRYAMVGRMLVDAVIDEAALDAAAPAGGAPASIQGDAVGVGTGPGVREHDASTEEGTERDVLGDSAVGGAPVGADTAEAGAATAPAPVFRAPGGGDPVLRAQGLAVELDPSEGAYPSGTSATASAALLLHALTAESRYRQAALAALAPLAAEAAARPISFGATLELLARAARPDEQLVLIEPDAGPGLDAEPPHAADPDAAMQADGLRAAVRMWSGANVVAVATEAEARMLAEGGFELFADRVTRDGRPTAYRCFDFVCRLPATSASALQA